MSKCVLELGSLECVNLSCGGFTIFVNGPDGEVRFWEHEVRDEDVVICQDCKLSLSGREWKERYFAQRKRFYLMDTTNHCGFVKSISEGGGQIVVLEEFSDELISFGSIESAVEYAQSRNWTLDIDVVSLQNGVLKNEGTVRELMK